ncbi:MULTISPECIES: DUF6226 family protein [unclassified Modestobacter]|uniref:DUF6226 family protein n=1 Tax=unclassified Modestobacter TaxID=2643866 RepID=UPI0022AA3E0F|nr:MULTISPECIES: DUF6226 family protein [unclassified Modestobacter]MCZ2824333.1 DUF6226 family protein [Modestobacter sp. VKM Ac-2981]MCZ2854139.1 DUF6226 family protein [Modestobacter sp. VKM Ac-2982]
MGDRWGPGGPPEDAYSRVTDPQRYASLHGVADRLVTDLVERYGVSVTDEPVRPGEVRAVRLHPRSAGSADLVVVHTEFGVRLRAGRWVEESFPRCGCDACDEEPTDLGEELGEFAADVVHGRLAEELTAGLRTRTLAVERPRSSATRSLTRDELRQLGPTGRHEWQPWPGREDT